MKEPYKWNYNIKIKTKDGEYEYEDKLENIEQILNKHKGYTEFRADKVANSCKSKVKKLVRTNNK